jgi:hypothetical protein
MRSRPPEHDPPNDALRLRGGKRCIGCIARAD